MRTGGNIGLVHRVTTVAKERGIAPMILARLYKNRNEAATSTDLR